ncbi:2-methylcitrate dehydratase PrpD [Sporomusaceae bacterium BoRhaA]|uniref:MmgE/PrpD family protein n=1 Tax=Pelorhabdus rhamnosifermentans TaxID=2772457 RepID=UPI001C062642|nr:MmgE/PrpD family protein [Pelorhabdus rhamnosifermentans]MBU2703302.1 2-methylcitrate dehydratase PrpD [Pelorhabdus rhamnosifermentans]
MTITTRLAEFFCELEYEKMPKDVVEKAKENLIDNLAGAIPAVHVEDVKGITDELKKYDKQEDCVLWGTNQRASVQNAALINGIAAHALEMDDFHPQGKIHMGTVVIPAAITLGEKRKISGKKLITALTAGYETGIRIAIGAGTASHRLHGWHATSSCGIFGAAISSAKILGLSVNQTVSALGLAGTQASGLWAFLKDGANNKKLHGGHPASAGITSAILAKGGMTGPSYILEAEDGGFYRATSDEYNFASVTEGLGEKYNVLRVGRKPYACCRSMHLSIEGALELVKEHKLNAEDIEKIDVYTYEIGVKQCGIYPKPQNVFEAKFSIPYGIAVAFLDGGAGVAQFTEQRIKDPAIMNLCSKIDVHVSDEYTKHYPANWGCEMRVRTKDGRQLTKVVWNGRGGPENPMTREELSSKFRCLAGEVLSDKRMDEIISTIYNLEQVKDISELTALLVP